ncbi:MAG: SH3 domain-containing protein [Rhodobacteraceae bacterium]|nr:SH3 domain-containing protein [Paracoccaceae bacterium]MCY4137690.1 SH3 domain-containing protein [Paracoccaceae bacterium]
MNGTLVRLKEGLALMIAVSMPLSEARAETVRIQNYTHMGCDVAGKRYLPAGADTGLVATVRLPEQRQQCLDAIKRMRVGCEMATDFQSTNPDGHSWKSGEKHPRCLGVFAAEIPACIGHYELEGQKCHGSGSETESEERERLALEAEEDMVAFPPNTWMQVLKDANVHAGPSTSARIVRLIPAGHAVRVSGRIGNWVHFGWLKDGEEQFVYAPLLREIKDPGASK